MTNRLKISELTDSQSIYTLPSCVHVITLAHVYMANSRNPRSNRVTVKCFLALRRIPMAYRTYSMQDLLSVIDGVNQKQFC
jgi:hypothetical protein